MKLNGSIQLLDELILFFAFDWLQIYLLPTTTLSVAGRPHISKVRYVQGVA